MIAVIDSSFLFSLAIDSDSNHEKAQKISQQYQESFDLIIPAEVFAETINTIWKKIGKDPAVVTAKNILEGQNHVFLETTKEIRQLALVKFEKQRKGVSFSDCIVMAFADAYKTKMILGFDEAFGENGYIVD
jgi:predicted nucleic acid-binding protein